MKASCYTELVVLRPFHLQFHLSTFKCNDLPSLSQFQHFILWNRRCASESLWRYDTPSKILAMGWASGVWYHVRKKFIFITASEPTPGPINPLGTLFPGVKSQNVKLATKFPLDAKSNNAWSFTSTHPYASSTGQLCLIPRKYNLPFKVYLLCFLIIIYLDDRVSVFFNMCTTDWQPINIMFIFQTMLNIFCMWKMESLYKSITKFWNKFRFPLEEKYKQA